MERGGRKSEQDEQENEQNLGFVRLRARIKDLNRNTLKRTQTRSADGPSFLRCFFFRFFRIREMPHRALAGSIEIDRGKRPRRSEERNCDSALRCMSSVLKRKAGAADKDMGNLHRELSRVCDI